MSYSTGTANDTAALRAAIFAACVADGWTLTSTVLSKGSQAMKIDLSTVSTASGLLFTGGKSQAAGVLVDACPYHVSFGDRTNLAMSWPVTYHVFSFASPDEVYVVINHDVDKYQYAAWGRSSHTLPGTGMWFAATVGHNTATPVVSISLSSTGALGSYSYTTPALLFRNEQAASGSEGYGEAFMHHGLDGDVWTSNAPGAPGPFAANSANPLIGLLPNLWNSEAVLLPIQALVARASNMSSLVISPANARYLRIDNYAPGDIITLGSEDWIVFPWLRKNSTLRNGPVGAVTTDLHSGTLGWALRYEGA